jgi:uncharacterized membrane protein (DUF4010 family)
MLPLAWQECSMSCHLALMFKRGGRSLLIVVSSRRRKESPVPNGLLPTFEWPYLLALQRLTLALALGLFVGLERERRGKEAGVRTFAFAALLGCLGGVLGESYTLAAIGVLALLIFFLNLQSLLVREDTELTTSAALMVVGFAGVLCGHGHTLTPTAIVVLTAALLSWKGSLSGFSLGLTESELRSAILLAILAFVIYPALPEGAADPWGLVELRPALITVLLIAGMGFGNYILLKLYGPRAIELTGFFGGLVNSTVTVTALAERVHEEPTLVAVAYRGIVLATAAMLVRNAVLLAIMAPMALLFAAPALILMLAGCLGLILFRTKPAMIPSSAAATLELQSPFSLWSALKFGALFLALKVIGTLAQQWLGPFGFYAVSLAGGLVSSASAAASAGSLARSQTISVSVAGIGAVIASLASATVNLPLVARIARERPLTRRIALALGFIVILGIAGAAVGLLLPHWLARYRLTGDF